MQLEQFIADYGKYVRSYKQYDNGVVRITFAISQKIMWLKRVMLEDYGMTVKTGNVGETYWFTSIDDDGL